jgi:hypothetical protein
VNVKLRKEIARQIFDRFGLLSGKEAKSFGLSGVMREEFVLDRRLVFIDGDRRQEGKVWGGSCEIGKAIVQVLVADTKDDIAEFSILVRADKLITYAVRLSEDPEDTGDISFHIEHSGSNVWIEAHGVMQARCLLGVETLSGQFLEWKKLADYKEMFGLLIEFVSQDGKDP